MKTFKPKLQVLGGLGVCPLEVEATYQLQLLAHQVTLIPSMYTSFFSLKYNAIELINVVTN